MPPRWQCWRPAAQNTVNTLSGGPEVSQLDLQRFSSDSFCRDRLAVMSVHRSRTEGGAMKLQIALRSERYGFFPEIWSWFTGENPYYINYRVDWFDPDRDEGRFAVVELDDRDFLPRRNQIPPERRTEFKVQRLYGEPQGKKRLTKGNRI